MTRKTSFQWFYKNQYGRGLTKQAKAYLSQKLRSYHQERRLKVIEERGGHRYSKIILWGCKDGEDYYPQLEIKAHIKSRLPVPNAEQELTRLINITKRNYDYNDFFEFPLTRRRTAYEKEIISKEELKSGSRKVAIISVYDGLEIMRNGFPQRRVF